MAATGFYLLTFLSILVVSFILAKSQSDGKHNRKTFGIALLIQLIWAGYIFAISKSGITATPGFPPRIVLFLVIPAIVGVVLFNTIKPTQSLIESISLKNVVAFQSFRIIVEILLFLSAKEMIVPQAVTFEGNNFDILIGLSAPIIAVLLNKGKLSATAFRVWNFAGLTTLLIVVATFMAKLFIPATKLPEADHMISNFGQAPFTFLPGYLMPLAVGLTILSLKRSKTLV